jgi:hypothetical protein
MRGWERLPRPAAGAKSETAFACTGGEQERQ